MDINLNMEALWERERALARAEKEIRAEREALEKAHNVAARRAVGETKYSRANACVNRMDKLIIIVALALCAALIIGIALQ